MTTMITKLNQKEVHSLIELAKKLDVKRFMYFNFIPTGRGSENIQLDLTPIEREKLLKSLYAESRTSGIEVLSIASHLNTRELYSNNQKGTIRPRTISTWALIKGTN